MQDGRIGLKIGPFIVRLQSSLGLVQDGINTLYLDYPHVSSDDFADYFIRIYSPAGLRRFWRKQVHFAFDQFRPFKPLPFSQALPFFEWGLNWCISGYAHQYLIIHAAVVEKNGKTLVLPGEPGSGKSTLCAALVNSGWRLLSDELTLIDRGSGLVTPVPRPVSLKNQSIELIKSCFPEARFSETVHDTTKGSVALMKPDKTSVLAMDQSAAPALVVFPRFESDAGFSVQSMNKAEAFMKLAGLSFNYPVLGESGFEAMTQFVKQINAFQFVYNGDFEVAFRCFDQLIKEAQ